VIRRGDWKLFLDREGNPQALYDLATDPLEFFDRSAAEPDIVRDLVARFERLEL
jgi:arylsulfatase A-like enzyme